ncbi:MAG: TIGR03546 family protein [Colwellia sp.]|nr:TIGR03546 family protein [Colwellia sp.]
MLTLLVKLFQALNSESSTRQISLAISLGIIVGLSPILILHNLIILFMVLVIRVNLGAFILAVGVFKGLSYLLSPLILLIGESLLTSTSLYGLFDSLYQMSLFKLAHWHHTYILGALILGVILALPAYFISRYLIEKYRIHIKSFIDQFGIVKALKASKFYRLYLTMSGQGGMS